MNPREVDDDLQDASMETDDEDDPQNPLDHYRQCWIDSYGRSGASFEDETDILPMAHTDGPVLPLHIMPRHTIQVFAVKVTQIAAALRWSLDVYGVVAVRDSMDRKRNVLFRRGRDDCQTLTSLQDSVLELIGPSRAVVLMDRPAFEVDLRVKGDGPPSQDKALSYYAFIYDNMVHHHKASYAITEVVPSEHSTVEVRFAHLADAVEATIAVRVVGGGSTTTGFRARFTARTESIDDDVVLLDSRCGEMAVADDGHVVLRRRVVVVEEGGELMLILGVEAAPIGDEEGVVADQIFLRSRSALRSEDYFNLGFCHLHVLVAWSMLP